MPRWPRAESVWALAWLTPGDGLVYRGDIEVVGGLLGVKVLLCHDAVFIEGLGAVPIELLLLEVGFGVFKIGLGGLLGCDEGRDVGLGGGDGGLLAGDIGGLLHILDLRQCLALLHGVTFFHEEMGDAAHYVGAHS